MVENVTLTDKRTRPEEKIDLLNFVNIGDTVRLTVEVMSDAYSLGGQAPSWKLYPRIPRLAFR
jgi:hypothetical protein